MRKKNSPSTSWEGVSQWYDKAVGEEGLYYHQKIILPKLLEKIPTQTTSLLDLACGQGVLSRKIPPSIEYVGVDLSPSLIQAARDKQENPQARFLAADITKPLPIQKTDFSCCVTILAIQNIENPLLAFRNAAKHLESQGSFFLVLNHPCFRIPKHSHWGIDPDQNLQYRRMDRYQSPIRIPIQSHPSQGNKSKCTYSFHAPLSTWTQKLAEAGFWIEQLEEWHSDKVSTGKYAAREDFSRKEFPLFLTIIARKKS